MSDFKAKMHQIRFRLGLRPRPRWGAHSAPPGPLDLGGLFLKGGRRGEARGGEERREEERRGDGERREGKGESPRLLRFSPDLGVLE